MLSKMLEPISPPKLATHTMQKEEAIALLKKLIATPSFSKEENHSADLIEHFLQNKQIQVHRQGNNVWCRNRCYNPLLPTILLNSHHDTVKPNSGYTLNPFEAIENEGKLYGLGSNDAGASLVSLMATFLHFYADENLKYNLIFSATAEEEISGKDGVASILEHLGRIDFAVVGEPTEMNLAIAEKGLIVLDCISYGTAAHAAHDHPDNAIINALPDLLWFRDYRFPKKSHLLGEVKMNVSLINAGTQHNVIPNRCEFTVDIRTTDVYRNEEVVDIIKQNVSCDIQPRSILLNSSSIDIQHPLVQAGISLGRLIYGSPTSSDMAVMNFPSVKVGPGNSLRSHRSDEFVFLNEIEEGITIYIKMLSKMIYQ